MCADVAAIETDRLMLRRPVPGDLEALHAILADPVAMRFWSTAPHRALAETQLWLEQMIAGSEHDFVVTCAGRTIGKFGAWQPPEIGFIFDRRTWGNGYATEAGRAFLRHAQDCGFDCLTADVDPRNGGSIRLLTRLGFRRTGEASRTYRIAGAWSDSLYFRRDLGAADPDQ